MKKHFLKSFALLAMLFSAMTMSAEPAWCNRVIGHFDPNGVGDKDDKSYVRLTVQDNQDGTISFIVAADPTLSKAAPDVDYVLINPGIGTAGDDATALESQTVKYSVPAGTEKLTVEILWSYSNWPGRYMVQNLEIPLSEICGTSDSGEGGETGVPVLESVELFGAAQTFVWLTPTVTDDKGVTSYIIAKSGGTETEVTPDATTGQIKISPLTIGTTYTYSVKAKDEDGNVSNAKEITFSTLDNVFCEEEVLPNTTQEYANQKITFTAKKVSDTETYLAISSSTSTLTKISTVTFYNNTGETGTYGGGVLPEGYVLKDGWTLTDNTLSKTVTWTTYPTAPFRASINASREKNSTDEKALINVLYTMDLSNTCGEAPVEPTPESIIESTYFAPNWTVDPTSSATYNAETGAITVDLKSQFYSQWQAQVKVKHDVAFSADKQYTLSCKFHATAAVGGVTIKMDDNQDNPVVFENASLSLPANEDYVYTSAPSNGIAGNNQILVFDFGWAPACQIVISDISIQEVEPTPEPEAPTVYCDFPTGHLNNADFGDANGRCLLTLTKISDKEVRVTVKPNYANGATKKMDYLYVISSGGTPYPAEAGADAAEGGYDELSVDITYASAPATYSFTIQWSNVADGGRWQVTLENIAPEQLCTEGTEGGEEPDPTPTEVYDVNFALASNGSSAEATSGDAAAAIDNNTGTRWESAAADPQTFIIDLGQERIFNTLEIVWEGAYAKTFTVSTSSDKTAWTPVWNVTGQELAGFPYTQTQTIDKTTARYVKFEGIERGTPYGYSFWEFRVYLAGVSILTSLEAKAENLITKIGATNTITITAKDQNGQAMADAGEVIYTITPADAGTITGNVYTPAKIGAASIVASIGEVAAAAFEVVAYDGENLAFSADRINANKVIAQSGLTDGSDKDAWYAVDGNDGSVWQGSLSNGTAGDEAARTFDSWFVVDFGAYYDINLVSIKFEGACAQDYHIDFSADNATWNVAYNHVGNNGINAHTKYIYGSDLQNTTKVRYARFYSTKAATEWGVKLFEFQVYGLPFVASGDTEKPVMGTATLDSNNHNTAIITVTATDNDEVAAYHIVDNANSYEQTLAPTDDKITLIGLNPETAYALTITALDLAGNESENAATVSFTTNVYNLKPTAAPAAPTHDATKVQSVFCDVYGGTFSAIEGWGQSTQFEELNFDGNYVRYYTNFNYLGWAAATPINASAMEKLHLDIWAPDNATLDIVPIYGGTGLTTDDGQRKKVTLAGQQWNSIDLTLTTDYPNLNLNSIFQFKFDNPTGADIFAFDNVYFYRESEIGDVTPPTNLTATAVPAFETAVISCQATDESSISYKVYLGAELKGTGSANSGETVAITVTNLQPNREFTMTVIATDVYGNESAETVDVNFTTLAYPSPAPTPMWAANNVKSIYSESYAPAFTSLNSYNEGWWNAPQMLDAAITNDNHALYYYGFTDGMIGWQFAAFDATGCTTFTMDIYPMNDGTIDFGPLGEGENDYAITNIPVKGGQWNTITVDLRDKDLTKIFQVKMINYYSLGAFFIDNVYLYKEVHQKVTESLEIIEDYAYNSLTITEEGMVTIRNGAKLIVKDFVIQSTMGAGKSGQLVGATLANFDVIGDAYIDITLGKDAAADQWHAFTVPFPVNALNGIYKTDGTTKLSNEVHYAIMDYHGDIRANGKYGWKKYHGDLVPGTFYIMTVNGDIKTFRFKKTDGSSVVAANNKALIAHDGSGTDTDKGWNGVGNPTLAYGSVAHAVQVLNPKTYTYETHTANETNFTVGTPFFIQADENGSMIMADANASNYYAPARQQTTDVKAKVYLSNENYTDRLYIHATDDATTTYEIGKDLVKMTMTNTPSVPQLFARAYNTDLCMIHTPLSNDEAVVALKLYAPADGEYTLSAEAQNGETIYLLKDNAIVWDLTASEYTIYLSQGNTEVYGVAIKRAPQVETGVNDGATIQTLPSKVILQGNLYILHNGQVYDAMGKCVK